MSVEPGWYDQPYLVMEHDIRDTIFAQQKRKCTLSPIIGRVHFIVFASFDLTTDLLADPVYIIHNVVAATFRLFSIPFVPGKRLESLVSAVEHTSFAIDGVLKVPCKLVRLPLVIANLLFVIIALPENAKTARYLFKTNLDTSLEIQQNIYQAFNKFSRQHSIAGRLFSIPVSLVDVSLELLKSPVRVIDFIVSATLAPRIGDFTGALKMTELALKEVWSTPITVLMAPVKFALQTCKILYDPAKASSMGRRNFGDECEHKNYAIDWLFNKPKS